MTQPDVSLELAEVEAEAARLLLPQQQRPGTCTQCEAATAELIAWSGERLCWDCTDRQLDLLALACATELPAELGTDRYGREHRITLEVTPR